jgi:hypothetical protein
MRPTYRLDQLLDSGITLEYAVFDWSAAVLPLKTRRLRITEQAIFFSRLNSIALRSLARSRQHFEFLGTDRSKGSASGRERRCRSMMRADW